MSRTSSFAAVVGGALLLIAGPALAAGSEQPGTGAWVRLTHLSPDTPEVDVSLTGLAGGESFIELQDVGYGDVSGYERIPAGTYTVSMRPAGSPEGTEPVITAAVEVADGTAYTVAAVGMNAELSGRLLVDDLTPPAAGQARVRVIQASVSAPTLDVATSTGISIAEAAEFGTATDYTEVEGGRWTLDITAESGTGTAQVDLTAGSVNTLFAIDQDDELTVVGVVDSVGAAAAPAGGVETGGRGLAPEPDGLESAVVLGLVAAGLAGAGGTWMWRRRPA